MSKTNKQHGAFNQILLIMKKFGFLLIFINAFAIQIAVADEAQEYQRSIDKIAKQISTISRNINANKAVIKTERDKLFSKTYRKNSKLLKLSKKTANRHLSSLFKVVIKAQINII